MILCQRITIIIYHFLLLLKLNTVRAIYIDDSALEESNNKNERNDRMPYEPPDPGSGNIWNGNHYWIKQFLKHTARGEKQKVLQALCANKTKQQIMENVENWARLQGPYVQTRFVILKERIKEMKNSIQKRIEQSTVLSEDAKRVLQNVRAVMEDMTITPEEELTQIRAATSQITPQIRRQIHDFMDLFRHNLQIFDEVYTTEMTSTNGDVTDTTTEWPEETTSESVQENEKGYVSDISSLNDFVRTALRVENTLRNNEPTVSANMDSYTYRDSTAAISDPDPDFLRNIPNGQIADTQTTNEYSEEGFPVLSRGKRAVEGYSEESSKMRKEK